MMNREPYPSDVSDAEWAFVAPYLPVMKAEAPQRDHRVRAVCNGLRWMVRAGASWRMMPPDLPPWHAVFPQTQRWRRAGVFATIVHALRAIRRRAEGSQEAPSAAILDRRTRPSTPERGGRAGDDGAKKRKGRKIHLAVDTLGHLLARHVTPANAQDRTQGAPWAEKRQEVTGASVEIACVDQGDTGENAENDAAAHGMTLEVVTLPHAKSGFILLPSRGVVERRVAWVARFRRRASDDEPLPYTLAGRHVLAFAILRFRRMVEVIFQSA